MDADGRVFVVEVQVEPNAHFARRSQYYWARLYSRRIRKGEDYHELVPVVCSNILCICLFPEARQTYTCFMARELQDPDLVLSDDLVIHFMELPKVTAGPSRLAVGERLLAGLGTGKEDDDMTILFKHDPLMARGKQAFDCCLEDEELRDKALARVPLRPPEPAPQCPRGRRPRPGGADGAELPGQGFECPAGSGIVRPAPGRSAAHLRRIDRQQDA